jgi:hypothetical protein
VLRASDLVPAPLQKGTLFAVDERVPTADLLERFTLRSEFGVIEVDGREMLAVRVAEISALDALAGMSRTEAFLRAAGNAAPPPPRATGHVAARPPGAVRGAPASIARFFDRVELGWPHVPAAAGAAGKPADERIADVGRRAGGVPSDVPGYELERRALARRLGVDPYTTNPVLAEKLDEIAWVVFSGRLGRSTLAAPAVPSSAALAFTSLTCDLVWDTPADDLIKLNQQRFQSTGAGEEEVRALIANRWFSLTALTEVGTGLDGLGDVPGREQIVPFAARASSEVAARLVARAVAMLATHHAKMPLARVSAPGPLAGHRGAQSLVVPAPVDYVAWTEPVAAFARRPELRARARTVWVTGRFSARARTELSAAGWAVVAAARPAIDQPVSSAAAPTDRQRAGESR